MIPLARLFRDHDDATSLAGLLDLWGFVGNGTFLTKSGAVGVVLSVHGPDQECLDHADRRHLAHRFEAAARLLDTDTRVYQYVFKRRARPIPQREPASSRVVRDALQRRRAYLEAKRDQLFEFETYFALLYEGWRPTLTSSTRLAQVCREPVAALRGWLSPSSTATLLRQELDTAVRRLHDAADAFATQLGDTLAPARLDRQATFAMLRRLVNYAPEKAEAAVIAHDAYLDFFVGDSAVTCHRAHLEVDDFTVRVLTLKDPPTRTCAGILDDLHGLPCEYIACSEWKRLDNAAMRRDIRAKRRHFHNAKVSLVNYLSSDTRPEDMLVDDSAAATVAQLGQALTEMEVGGHYFGEFSLTLVLFDRDPEQVRRGVNGALKVMSLHDGALYEESYNALNAWLATVPGSAAYNVRRLPILDMHYADLSFLSTLDSGEVHSPVTGLDHVAVFETEAQTPFYYGLHYLDVPHTFVCGATGSGKSFWLNFQLLNLQAFDPLTVIFDLGASYKKLTALLGGSYVQLGLGGGEFTINPWSLEPTQEHLHFLAAWTRVLIESGGRYQTTLQDDRQISEAVESVYHVDPSLRRLSTLANLLPRGLSQYLARWVGTGPYAAMFDHATDTLTLRALQTFDFQSLQDYPAVVEALLFYVFHRVDKLIHDPEIVGRLKIFVMDEAWRLVQNDVIQRHVVAALKTWRKHNGAMIVATQSTDDLAMDHRLDGVDHDRSVPRGSKYARSSLLAAVLGECPTRVFLPNPGLDVNATRELFHLNETEISRITKLVPRRQFLLKRPGRSGKVLNLCVDDLSYWLYTNTPLDTVRANAILAEHGLEAGLQLLAQASAQENVGC